MVKNLPANAEDLGSISVLGRSPGEGNGNLLQHSFLENPKDRGVYSPWDHKESDMPEQLNNNNMYRLSHVSVSEGCYNQVPYTGYSIKTETCLSHGSGGEKSKAKV